MVRPIAILAERCVVEPTAWSLARDLYRAYVAWATDEGIPERKQLSRHAFGRRLGKRFSRSREKDKCSCLGVDPAVDDEPPL